MFDSCCRFGNGLNWNWVNADAFELMRFDGANLMAGRLGELILCRVVLSCEFLKSACVQMHAKALIAACVCGIRFHMQVR